MTNYERQVLCPIVIKFIKSNRGQSVTSQKIIEEMASHGYYILDSSLRKIIKEVQAEGKVKFIISDISGFRYTTSKKAVLAQIAIWEKRASAITKQIAIVRKQLK